MLRSTLRDLLPSMFHRRLLLLAAAMLVVMVVLSTSTAMLATGQSHREARELAESKLRGTSLIETRRGAILDRNGLVLAEDDLGWELAIHYDLLTGRWSHRKALADASADRLAWREMSQPQRDRLIARHQAEYEQQIAQMFQTLAEVSGVAPRELEQRRVDTVERVHQMQTHIWAIWREQAQAERGEPVSMREVAEPIAPELQHHPVLVGLTEAQRLVFAQFIESGRRAQRDEDDERGEGWADLPWTMAQIRRTTVRRYPMDVMTVELDRSTLPSMIASDEVVELEVRGVGLHIIGLMRDVWAEDVQRLSLRDYSQPNWLQGYDDGDRIGRSGIEGAMEMQLRGWRGMRTINLDTGDPINEAPPRAGDDVMLAIDIRLQARVQAILSPEFGLMQTLPWHIPLDQHEAMLGRHLNGAAVVMDIASGDVLAAVTAPSVPRDGLQQDAALFWGDDWNRPMDNRPFQVAYQPGSTMKPLVLAAAVTDGVLGPSERIDTPGYLWEDRPHVFRDWYWKRYQLVRGEIGGVEAIEVSSNPFFGMMAERMMERHGRGRLSDWYSAFGLGVRPNTGIPEEVRGAVRPGNRTLEHNDVCFMSIGQGPVNWSPLQAATAYARLASGNLSLDPRLVVYPERPGSEPDAPAQELSITDVARQMALDGMLRSANERQGTTHHLSHAELPQINGEPIFNVQGVTVMAKSGTADPGDARWIDFNGNEQIEEAEVEYDPRDHAWVIAVVTPNGAPHPTHVVAVVVEYAGSGGQVAGPVVNQVIHALQHHHYLEWPPAH